jgi:hypothetical protein
MLLRSNCLHPQSEKLIRFITLRAEYRWCPKRNVLEEDFHLDNQTVIWRKNISYWERGLLICTQWHITTLIQLHQTGRTSRTGGIKEVYTQPIQHHDISLRVATPLCVYVKYYNVSTVKHNSCILCYYVKMFLQQQHVPTQLRGHHQAGIVTKFKMAVHKQSLAGIYCQTQHVEY